MWYLIMVWTCHVTRYSVDFNYPRKAELRRMKIASARVDRDIFARRDLRTAVLKIASFEWTTTER